MAMFLNLRFLLFFAPPFPLGVLVPFPSFLVKAAIARLALDNSLDSSAIVLVKEEIVLRSDDAAETKFASASWVSVLTAFCASTRFAASR